MNKYLVIAEQSIVIPLTDEYSSISPVEEEVEAESYDDAVMSAFPTSLTYTICVDSESGIRQILNDNGDIVGSVELIVPVVKPQGA